MNYEICKAFNDTPCRFASIETTLAPFTAIKLQDNHYIPIKHGYKKNVLGIRCNNSGTKMASELTQCPARLALAYEPWCSQKADGTGIYAKLIGSMEMKALMSERVLGQTTLEGVV